MELQQYSQAWVALLTTARVDSSVLDESIQELDISSNYAHAFSNALIKQVAPLQHYPLHVMEAHLKAVRPYMLRTPGLQVGLDIDPTGMPFKVCL